MSRQFGSLETQKLHDKTHGSGSKHESFPKSNHESKTHESSPSHDTVVAEHGPAHEIHIKHDHQAGKHHVHSTHESGHQQHADFNSAKEAHNHASLMAGAAQEQEPQEDEGAMSSAAGPAGIPTMGE